MSSLSSYCVPYGGKNSVFASAKRNVVFRIANENVVPLGNSFRRCHGDACQKGFSGFVRYPQNGERGDEFRWIDSVMDASFDRGNRPVHRDGAYRGTPEHRHDRSNSKFSANIPGERPDVGSGRDFARKGCRREAEIFQFERKNLDVPLWNFEVVALPSHPVGAFSVDSEGAVLGGNLRNPSSKIRQCAL